MPPPTWKDAAFWVALAAVPAGLLVAVTAHLSTDVGAAPLLWVLPLALYLLTFVVAFSRRPIIPHRLVVALQPPFVVALVAVIIFGLISNILWLLALHLAVFFVNALMCHGELARTRPPPRYLTAFYLWISAGGVIGGIATALIAPHVFNSVAEYPILIALAVLCRPGLALPRGRRCKATGGESFSLSCSTLKPRPLGRGFLLPDFGLAICRRRTSCPVPLPKARPPHPHQRRRRAAHRPRCSHLYAGVISGSGTPRPMATGVRIATRGSRCGSLQ
jgi:hypothetical protein